MSVGEVHPLDGPERAVRDAAGVCSHTGVAQIVGRRNESSAIAWLHLTFQSPRSRAGSNGWWLDEDAFVILDVELNDRPLHSSVVKFDRLRNSDPAHLHIV